MGVSGAWAFLISLAISGCRRSGCISELWTGAGAQSKCTVGHEEGNAGALRE